jgi:hypothetical protein
MSNPAKTAGGGGGGGGGFLSALTSGFSNFGFAVHSKVNRYVNAAFFFFGDNWITILGLRSWFSRCVSSTPGSIDGMCFVTGTKTCMVRVFVSSFWYGSALLFVMDLSIVSLG